MLKGIDTSHHNDVNLVALQQIVKLNTLYFNFIKASEGATIQDPKFTDNWKMSRDAGLICGAYHFFRPLANAAVQATNFITQYKTVSRAGVLPPVVDIEWATVKVNNISVEQWKQVSPAERIPRLKIFLSALEAELKIKPIIYTASAFWNEFIVPQSSAADNTYFSEFLLWNVDLRRSGNVPAPWTGTTAPFIQTHFGENATTSDLFDKLDQDEFTGDLKSLLNITVPGFTVMKSFPFSNLVIDLQTKLIEKGFLHDTADGQFGGNTEKSVKDFQAANSLFANGIIDAQTWNKLL